MNKKADITIVLLVLGIIAVCFFAIITFLNSNLNTQNSFKRIRIIWDMNQRIESNTLRSNTLSTDSSGKNYYEYLLQEKKFWIHPISSLPKILFRVRYYPHLNT